MLAWLTPAIPAMLHEQVAAPKPNPFAANTSQQTPGSHPATRAFPFVVPIGASRAVKCLEHPRHRVLFIFHFTLPVFHPFNDRRAKPGRTVR